MDTGLRNFSTGTFGAEITHQNSGFLFPNLIFNTLYDLLENTSWSLHYWRTKDGAEVDFVLNRGKDIVPVEVKFSDLKEPKITRSLHSFINTYHPDIAFMVNLSLS